MGLGRFAFWMVKFGLGIGMLYGVCSLSFKYGRIYERNSNQGRSPGIAVSRQLSNDIHDMLEELNGSPKTEASTIDEKVKDNYQTKTEDWRAELQKKYSQMAGETNDNNQ